MAADKRDIAARLDPRDPYNVANTLPALMAEFQAQINVRDALAAAVGAAPAAAAPAGLPGTVVPALAGGAPEATQNDDKVVFKPLPSYCKSRCGFT